MGQQTFSSFVWYIIAFLLIAMLLIMAFPHVATLGIVAVGSLIILIAFFYTTRNKDKDKKK
jgi:L-asparagine transporter-like permease